MFISSRSTAMPDKRWLPKRIVLVRHGESNDNDNDNDGGDPDPCVILPGHSTPLTRRGAEQANRVGTLIRDLLDHNCPSWKIYVYVSPYECTRSTLREMGRALPRSRLIGVREECRVREQDFGNFQDAQKMKQLKEVRNKFGRFFFRFPEGESGADVYDRVSSFLESMWRDIDMQRFPHDEEDELNLIIVSHGLAIRIFLMRWFQWTVEQFELLKNPKNCEFRVMQLGEGGEYSLAVHHDEARLRAWGLSEEMIAEQKLRASMRTQQQAEEFLMMMMMMMMMILIHVSMRERLKVFLVGCVVLCCGFLRLIVLILIQCVWHETNSFTLFAGCSCILIVTNCLPAVLQKELDFF